MALEKANPFGCTVPRPSVTGVQLRSRPLGRSPGATDPDYHGRYATDAAASCKPVLGGWLPIDGVFDLAELVAATRKVAPDRDRGGREWLTLHEGMPDQWIDFVRPKQTHVPRGVVLHGRRYEEVEKAEFAKTWQGERSVDRGFCPRGWRIGTGTDDATFANVAVPDRDIPHGCT